ncbi:hypothetical protein [Synechococcus sp. CBW1108]|uniref:hypothetical protein n=1 Tax=Synechococcus sp. CBW1108 TaxID=1353147 RepID=UPI0018CE9378|nr:hypothetical protein [Synechococcus sp. CBW1108]QPN68986.1 hypothetical protein H8F27_09955 [Synechococcus sp. CBW1108]
MPRPLQRQPLSRSLEVRTLSPGYAGAEAQGNYTTAGDAGRLSALVGLLGSAFHLSFSKTQALLQQLVGVELAVGQSHGSASA